LGEQAAADGGDAGEDLLFFYGEAQWPRRALRIEFRREGDGADLGEQGGGFESPMSG
jgi:hypothetical protein